jgi:hypothetical protein
MKYKNTEEDRWVYRSKNGFELECWVCFLESNFRAWRTGYVKKPIGLPDEFNAECSISVHGGVTFDNNGVIGFDTAHSGDTPEEWTFEATKSETERMAEDLSTHVSQLIYLTRSVEES